MYCETVTTVRLVHTSITSHRSTFLLVVRNLRSPLLATFTYIVHPWAFLVAQTIKDLPARQETWVRSLGRSPAKGNGYPLLYSCLENAQSSVADYSPWGRKESDTTEGLTLSYSPLHPQPQLWNTEIGTEEHTARISTSFVFKIISSLRKHLQWAWQPLRKVQQ